MQSEALKKTQVKMKKLEETEQRLLGDLQKKEAEVRTKMHIALELWK